MRLKNSTHSPPVRLVLGGEEFLGMTADQHRLQFQRGLVIPPNLKMKIER
ncbi:MAG: hypothetical protein WBD40_13640 [Tepidisphaeraceae bacterium]